MLHPFLIIAGREILAGMRAAAFLTVGSRIHRHHRLRDEIVEFQRFQQIRVPDQRTIGHLNIGRSAPHLMDQRLAFMQHLTCAVHGAIILHRLLHLQTKFRRLGAARGVTETIQPCECRFTGIRW